MSLTVLTVVIYFYSKVCFPVIITHFIKTTQGRSKENILIFFMEIWFIV